MPQRRNETTRRPIAWLPVIGAMVAGASLVGGLAWWSNIQSVDHRIADKRTAIKKLVLSGGVPPNQEVMDYLTSRQARLNARYHTLFEAAAAPPLAEAASTDPQVYFQEQLHGVQRALERLAAARSLGTPQLLGFPKDLPPTDTVPRLLVQLALIQQLADLSFEQGIAELTSFKIEDPDPMPDEQGTGSFLLQLPVRLRVTGTLAQVMKLLAAMDRARPLIDVRVVRLATMPASAAQLEAECVASRYLPREAPR